MKVKELIEQNISIDVYDDVCEELGIAFDGPLYLTEQGQDHFKDVLEYDVALHNDGRWATAIVNVDGPEGVWQKRLRKAKEFFESAAGYCSFDDYELWFDENNTENGE